VTRILLSSALTVWVFLWSRWQTWNSLSVRCCLAAENVLLTRSFISFQICSTVFAYGLFLANPTLRHFDYGDDSSLAIVSWEPFYFFKTGNWSELVLIVLFAFSHLQHVMDLCLSNKSLCRPWLCHGILTVLIHTVREQFFPGLRLTSWCLLITTCNVASP
jgi:hypothetical protein